MTVYYCTAAEVKSHYRKGTFTDLNFETDAAYTTALEAALADIDKIIDSHTHRQFFALTTQTEIFDGKNQQRHFPANTPIITLTKIEQRGSQTDSWTEITLTDFYRYAEYIFYEYRFTEGYQNWRMTFSHGYAAVPTDIRRVAIMMGAAVVQQWKLNLTGQIMKINDYNVQVPLQELLTPEIKGLLKPYVKHPVAVTSV